MSGAPESLSHWQIAGCFNRGVGRAHRVRLVGGAREPLYLPPVRGVATIRYTRDYPASALHELAHWCIAGAGRRARVDYGYWYRPPPRDARAHQAFVRVEVPVQALESRFAAACGLPFRVSVDDVQGPAGRAEAFSRLVSAELAAVPESCLPPRARLLLADLRRLSRIVGVAGGDGATLPGRAEALCG